MVLLRRKERTSFRPKARRSRAEAEESIEKQFFRLSRNNIYNVFDEAL